MCDQFLEVCRLQDRPAAQVIREFMRACVAGPVAPDASGAAAGQRQKHSHAKGDLLSKKATVVRVSTREAGLKRRLRRHLTSLGFQRTDEGDLAPPGTGKEAIRTVHGVQREDRLAANKQFLSDQFPKLAKHFAPAAKLIRRKSRLHWSV